MLAPPQHSRPDLGSSPGPFALYPESPEPISASDASNGVVFRTRNIECFYQNRDSETLIVSFNEMGATANGRDFWCSKPAERRNVSIFGFVSTQPNWFPAGDMLRCLQAFWACTWNSRHRRVVALGLSQGAYGALKFHRALGADISIAFSPQISIDPRDIVDYRFNGNFSRDDNLAMRVQSKDVSTRCYLLYDPYNREDAMHARMLEDLGNITSVRLPFVGHSSVRPFTGRNLWELIEACFATKLTPIRALYVSAKRVDPQRPRFVAQTAVDRHPRIALQIFEKYGRASRDSRWLQLCWRLGEAGLGSHVLSWLQELVQANPKDDKVRQCLCLVAIRLGKRDLAVELAQRLLSAEPGDPRRRYIMKQAQELAR